MNTQSLIEPIPHHWKVTTLGEMCARGGGNVQTGPFGSQLHASDYVEWGIPSIMPQNIGENRVEDAGIARIRREDAERLSRYRVQPGDIVYSRRGDVEKRALISERENGWLCGTGCLRIRFGDGWVDPRFASYYLGHPSVRQWIVRHAHGATMPNLNTAILSELPFVIAPLPEQRAIAHILGTFDDKIELNRKMNETLDEIARTLFTSWFVNFDPVRAKAEGRQSEGIDAETAALFPDRFVDSALGPIPQGWSVMTLDEFGEVLGGGTPKTSVTEFWNGDIPWFSMSDLPNTGDIYVIDTKKHITAVGEQNSSAKILPANMTILTARGTVGQVAMAGVPMSINQSCYGLYPRDHSSTSAMYFWTRASVELLRQRAHGSVFATITRNTLSGIKLAVPPLSTLKSFELLVAPILSLIKNNVREINTLAHVRETLLPRLLSGEVEVSSINRLHQ